MNFEQRSDQTFIFSQIMKQKLSILSMNRAQISILIDSISEHNPFIKTRSFETAKKNKNSYPIVVDEILAQETNLYQEIREELLLDLQDPNDEKILYLILGSLNSQGFLETTSQKLCDSLPLNAERTEFLRKKIMHSSYPGLGSIDYYEYLEFITKNQFGETSVEYQIADFIKHFKKNKIRKEFLYKKLKLPQQEIDQALENIKKIPLSPLGTKTFQIIPDFEIKIHADHISVVPYRDITEEIIIPLQAGSSKQGKEAKLFLDALNLRKQGLQQHADALVNLRKDFFLGGTPPLQSVGLKEVGKITGRHISTVSRALSGRYFTFNGEIYPFSSLLMHKVGKSSSLIVKNLIKKIIDNEDKNMPLSDDSIALILKKQGHSIARRTISKYRHDLGIGSIHERKLKQVR